jgi:hypothetical protein
MEPKPRNNPIASMIYNIDNGIEISDIGVKYAVREIQVNSWIDYINEYLLEKQRYQLERVKFGHYGEWFTPDILNREFTWERI